MLSFNSRMIHQQVMSNHLPSGLTVPAHSARWLRFFSYLCLFCIGLVLRPFITSIYPFSTWLYTEYGFNSIEIALLTSIPVLCMGVFAWISRYLEHLFRRERIIFFAILMIAAGFFLRGYSEHKTVLMVATVLGGMGLGLGGGLVGGLIKDHLPKYAMNSMSVYSVGIGAGAAVGSRILLADWQWNQRCLGLVTLLCAFIFMSCFGRKAIVRVRIEDMVSTADTSHYLLSLLVIIFGVQALINYTLLTWITSYYQNLSAFSAMDYRQIAFLLLMIQLCAAYVVPQILSRYCQKIGMLVLLTTGLLVSLVLLYSCPVSAFWYTLFGLGVTTGAIFPISMSLPILLAVDAKQAGKWFATMLGVGYLISAIGPMWFGLILVWFESFSAALYVLLSLSLLLMITVCLLYFKLREYHDIVH